ncbi:methionyl-tRNA formyltransferase [Anaeromassilibacillus senegalensis]|uniref:Methionyl-tRNA formyltransferase n=1 Tax=Anaeromassilibacillus senegalensis TaxID=1673717 RepID=A0ABS9CKJ7_9FIRM|nr:methionyl-tRNA formyltransferase [Anaeromassilibacillus senegalensis]MCF2651569.1 methionyl-tRNA formyltransferase [Anaeromassilibacillus senegalensis]
MRIVFMGTPDFAVPSLEALLRRGHEIAAVYTQPDKPKGRGHKLLPPPVKVLALEHNIPVCQPTTLRNAEAVETLRAFEPELIVVAAYGKILPPDVLTIPPRGCINVHGSLLPQYRGAAPIQWAVLNGDKISGVTIQRMAEGVDTGDILAKAQTEIDEDETSGELFDRLMMLGAELLIDTIDKLDTLTPEPQDEALATHAPMLQKEMGAVDWAKPASEVHNLVRGLNPWPAAYLTLDGKRMKLWRTKIVKVNGLPGVLTVLDGEMTVYCGSDAVQLLEIQPENGKRMRGSDYLRGHPLTGDIKVQ